jgi:hypothetical protein
MIKANKIIDFIKEEKEGRRLHEYLASDVERIMDKIVTAIETTHKDDEQLAKALDLLEEARDILANKRM